MPIKVYKVHHGGTYDLNDQMVKIPGLVVQFQVSCPSHVFISGSVGYEHRKIPLSSNTDLYGANKTEYAIGIVGRLEHTDENGDRKWITGSKWGTNIASGSHHYAIIPISGYIEVNAGTHEISFWAEAHTDAPGAYSHPVEIKGARDSDLQGGTSDPYNQMIVRIEDK